MVGDTESEASWGEFFSSLKQRGLHALELLTSDHPGGLVRAVRQHFQSVTWQRCQTHFTRNVLNAAPKTLQSEIKGRIRSVFEAPNPETARKYLEQTLAAYQESAPKAMAIFEQGFDDATAVLEFPELYRTRLRTSNGMERLNAEIRRREFVIRIFPNRDSVVKLIGAMLMEMEERWIGARCYMNMTEYHEWRKTPSKAPR